MNFSLANLDVAHARLRFLHGQSASLLAGQIFHLGFAAYFCFHFGLFLFQLLLCGHFLSRLQALL